MRKIKLFLSLLMVMLLSIGQVWAAEELKATLDFTTNDAWQLPVGSGQGITTATDYSDGNYTVNLSATTKYYFNSDGYLMIGKSGSKITLPAFSWKTTKIVVTGRTGASTGTKQNIYVGETAVSTETTGCTGANTYNIASANQAAGNVYVFQVTSNHNAQVTKIEIYGEDAGTPAKTLTSIAVSGTPTKTSYYAGDNFDPAGLTVTGTYSDASTAPITSGITWSYDPSQELALNQTSIGVIATVSEKVSPKFNVTGLTVSAAPAASNWQVTDPTDLATGDVVVLTMLKNSVYYAAPNNGTGAPAATVVAVANSKLSNSPAETLQWTVTVVEDGVYQFSKGTNYLKCTDTNNGVRVGTGDYNTFDVVVENEKSYLHTTETMTSATNGRFLGIYNTQDWRCYTSVNNNIKDGSLVIFREPASSKENAGLAYAAADAQKLVKVGGSLVAPTLSNENNLTVTYASSDADVVAVDENTGALTIKAVAGKAVITASSEETSIYKAGSASYTIYVAEQAGTAEDPLTEASAKDLIDLGCTMSAHVTGTIQGKTYYSNSGSYNVTLTNGFLFYYFYAAANSTPFESDILTNGDELVGYGQLMKYGNNYEINPSYMVSRVPYSEPLVDISNTPETAYTPAQAIALYDDPASDLTKEVYVKGVVVATPALKYNDGLTGDAAVYNGTYNVYVKAEDDLSENPTKFEFFRMYADDNNTTFEDGDIQVGEVIIAKGILSKYNSTYEFAQGCQMYSKKSKVTMTFDDLEMEVEDVETLAPKTITLATAEAVTYAIKEGSDDCITLANGVVTATAEGTATIVATLATVEAYIGTSVEFTVTVSAAAPVLTDYYEKVTATENITDGTYLIVYENGNVAFNGGLETLDAESNTIAVAITNDNKIGVTEATAAATFFIDVTAGSIQAANGKYIGVSSNSNGLKTSDDASTYTNAFAIDNDGNAVISAVFSESTMTMRYNSASNQARFRYYKDNGQQAIQLYKLANETVKANPELAWGPADDIVLTVGDEFTAPTLSYAQGFDGLEAVVITSSNTALAQVNAGVVSLVAEATGEATITATFAGNDNYKAATASYKITVNAVAPTPLPTAEAKVIVVEYNSKFYAMSTTVKNSNGFEPIEVTKEDDKIIVKSNEDADAIQWQIALGTEAATFQNGDAKYLACSDESNTGLALLDAESEWAWDATASCYKQPGRDSKGRTFYYNYNSGNPIFRAYLLTTIGGEGYSGAPEFIDADKIEVQVPATKIDPELAFDPTEVELTLGETFTAPTLGHVEGFNGTVTYSSSKPAVATVDENTGVVTIVAHGTTTITASFEGNDDYEEDEATYTITVNKPAPTPTSTIYRKVTATADITDGEYLIVYEGDATHDAAVFDGSLDNDNIDIAKKVLAVEIENDEIAGNTELDAAVFTIDVTAGSLQSASGLYIGRTANSNGMDKSTTEAYVNTFAIAEGEAVITGVGGCTLRYNYAVDQLRFRYYKSGQQAIQLYKKETPEPPVVNYTEVRNGLTEGWYYTMCLDKAVTAVKAGSIWKVLSKAANGNDVILEEVTGTLDAGRPYIFRAAASTLEVAYTGDAVGAPVNDDDNNGLIGSFLQTEIEQSPNNFIIYNNALYYVDSEKVYVGANRAYLDMTGVPAYSNEPQQGNAPRRRVTMAVYGEQTTTGIDALNAAEAPVKVLINGQMYILRGEKMYNVNGQVVK